MNDRLARIAWKLEKLGNLEFLRRVTGAKSRWHRMRPTLSSAELKEFKRKNNVSLPEEYARFITTIGNGGPGPYYGLQPLEPSSVDERLVKPFPHTGKWNFPEELFVRWGREEEEQYFSDEYVFGTLPIAHEGCGLMHLLVVTGAERGNVWCDHRASDGGIYPLARGSPERRPLAYERHAIHQIIYPLVRVKPGQAKRPSILYRAAEGERCSFLDWYEHWLDAELARPRSRTERIVGAVRSIVRKIRRVDFPSKRLKE